MSKVQSCLVVFVCSSILAMVGCVEERAKQPSAQNNLLAARMAHQEATDKLLVKTIHVNKELQEKVARLEAQMESLTSYIRNEMDQTKLNQVERSASSPRSCHEIQLTNPSLSSGMYWIDPDGQGIGDGPIYVYCDVKAGKTTILHDSEEKTDVGHCLEPGCYSKSIVYNATMRQIKVLIDLSAECRQSIRYDCNYAPFVIGDVIYSWWNDRDGKQQSFWAGSGSRGHICQCGIDGNCVDVLLPCNCDSLLPLPLYDSGVITSKDFLPITKLNFGRTQLSTSSGQYTLGRLDCSGQSSVNRIPSSCADLWQIGHTFSGLYPIKSEKSIDMVYCNFTKQSTDSGYQTLMGSTEIKVSQIYFEVQRNTQTSGWGVLKYESEVVNLGGGMSPATGIFTAPRNGIYFFAFSGYSTASIAGENSMDVDLMVGGNIHLRATFHPSFDGQHGDSASLQSIVQLKQGDQVFMNIANIYASTLFDNSPFHYTHFSGGLLHEDV